MAEWWRSWHPVHVISAGNVKMHDAAGTHDHEGEEDELGVEAFPNNGNLEEEVTLLDRLDGRRPPKQASVTIPQVRLSVIDSRHVVADNVADQRSAHG